MKILIGSTAIRAQLKETDFRIASDKDFLVSESEERTGGDFIKGNLIFPHYKFASNIATLDEILTLKVSHSPWVITNLKDWSKHLKDIAFLQTHGAKIVEPLYKYAYKQWESAYGVKTITLDKTKEDFFNNSVERFYDHDSVHAAVALAGEPAFNKILLPGEQVKTSHKAFEKLTLEERKRLVFEECMVLSLERDLIPRYRANEPDKNAIYTSYRKQLRLLITQYSKGYFSRYIIENYFSVVNPPLNYWTLFQDSDKKVRL